MATNRDVKHDLIKDILTNEVYQDDSGIYLLAYAGLMKISLTDIHAIHLIISLEKRRLKNTGEEK